MGKMNFLGHFETVSGPLADRRGRPFADPVHGQDHRLLERRRKKRRRRVALVMFGEKQFILPVEFGVERLEFLAQQVLLEKLFAQPYGHRHVEGLKPLGRERQIGFQ